jgi:hypothetical protein
MKNILITHDCFVGGKPHKKGEVLKNIDNSIASQLLTSGRATLDLSKVKDEEPEKVLKPVVKKQPKKKSAR